MRRFYAPPWTWPRPRAAGFAVRLDGRTPRSPAGRPLVLPTLALAELIAQEWAAQGENIDPDTMLATRLAWTALALDEAGRAAAVERVAAFAGAGPALLLRRLARRPAGAPGAALGAGDRLGRRSAGRDIPPHPGRRPPAAARSDARPDPRLAGAEDDFALTGLVDAAGLFGSAILAFALRRAELTAEAAFALSRLDETFQEEKWGVDSDAAFRADAMAAEAVLLQRWFEGLAGRTR